MDYLYVCRQLEQTNIIMDKFFGSGNWYLEDHDFLTNMNESFETSDIIKVVDYLPVSARGAWNHSETISPKLYINKVPDPRVRDFLNSFLKRG